MRKVGQAPDVQAPSAPAPDRPSDFKPATHSLVAEGDVPILEQIDRENTRVVAAATPTLVRITSLMQVDPHSQLLGFPFRFPGVPHGMRTIVPSYGSGVIISRDGYIVTNFHVVRDARSVDVELADLRTFTAHLPAVRPGVGHRRAQDRRDQSAGHPVGATRTRSRLASRSSRWAIHSTSTPR